MYYYHPLTFCLPFLDKPIAMSGCRSVEDSNVVPAHPAYIGAFGDHESRYCEIAGEDPAGPGL